IPPLASNEVFDTSFGETWPPRERPRRRVASPEVERAVRPGRGAPTLWSIKELFQQRGKERAMRMRVLVGVAALAVAGACAHGSARSDKVSDEVLARVPADQMGDVNQARMDVGKAQDALAREKVRLEQAKKYVDVANGEAKVAAGQLDRDQAAQQAADYARDEQAKTQAQSAQGLARQRQQVAAAHLQAANQLVSYGQERVNAAQKAVDLANARLGLAKYKALQASGDKAVADIDAAAIQKRVEDSRVALEQER